MTTAWLVNCPPGLAPRAAAEMKQAGAVPRGKQPTVKRRRNHDLLFVQGPPAAPDPARLFLADSVHRCLIFGRYKVSEAQLARLAEGLRAAQAPRRLAVSVDGRHFDRRAFGRWLARAVERHGADLDPDDGATEDDCDAVFLTAIDDAYYVSLRVGTDRTPAHRTRRSAERAAALPPTVAAAMAFYGRPLGGERVRDFCCGSGTILSEAAARAPGIIPIGRDVDPQAVAAAAKNLDGVPELDLARGDATATGLPNGSVDLFLANLPFGKTYGRGADLEGLYLGMLREAARLASGPTARAVLLTSASEALEAAAGPAGWRMQERLRLTVRGEPAVLHRLRRRGRGPQRDAPA